MADDDWRYYKPDLHLPPDERRMADYVPDDERHTWERRKWEFRLYVALLVLAVVGLLIVVLVR